METRRLALFLPQSSRRRRLYDEKKARMSQVSIAWKHLFLLHQAAAIVECQTSIICRLGNRTKGNRFK